MLSASSRATSRGFRQQPARGSFRMLHDMRFLSTETVGFSFCWSGTETEDSSWAIGRQDNAKDTLPHTLLNSLTLLSGRGGLFSEVRRAQPRNNRLPTRWPSISSGHSPFSVASTFQSGTLKEGSLDRLVGRIRCTTCAFSTLLPLFYEAIRRLVA